ncbi:unnamed protein product [Withania somnifera]
MPVHFQENILMDIFSRLPVRSLLRFKCVSKFWETLIDEPYLSRKHLSHTKNDQKFQNFLFYQLRPEEPIFSIYCVQLTSAQLVANVRELDFPLNDVEPRYCEVRCCCNGLVIISVCENIAECRKLLLWNPLTRESIVLPTPEISMKGFPCFGMNFDSASGDYKILKIHQVGNEGRKSPGEILTLKSGSWRKIDDHPPLIHNVLLGMHSLPFIHGAFHWVGMSKKYFVLSFNISHEVYAEIPLPDQIFLSRIVDIGVSELDGMLCAYSKGYHTFKLWVMKDYGLKESWNAIFSIEIPHISTPVPKYRFANGEVLFRGIDGRHADSAFWTRRGPFTLLPRGLFQNGFTFIESLISPILLIT